MPYDSTGEKIVRVLSVTGASHVSFACFGLRNAIRSHMGQSGIFVKMRRQGESQENLEELGKAAGICWDLWGAVESLQRAVEIVGVSLTSHEIKRKCMDM